MGAGLVDGVGIGILPMMTGRHGQDARATFSGEGSGSVEESGMFAEEVAVGHAGNVVRRGSVKSIAADAVLGFASEIFGIFDQVLEQLGNPPRSLVVDLGNFGASVEVLKQMTPQGREFLPSRLAESGEAIGVVTDVVEGLNASLEEILGSLANEVIHQEIHQAPNQKPPIAWDVEIGVFRPGGILGALPKGNLFE
jgi:hypothetical protein